MRTIKELSQRVLRVPYKMHGKKTNTWARDIAKFIVEYCGYLENVLQTFPITKIIIEVQPDCSSRLLVDYKTGSSSIYIDVIYQEVLIPEVEQIVKKHRKRIVIKEIVLKAA